MRSETAFFVGKPDRLEEVVLNTLRQQYYVRILSCASSVYQHMALEFPDMLMFASGQQNTTTLRLFRQLRRTAWVCVAVCYEDSIQAFLGKGYRHRCWLPKNTRGAYGLFTWKEHVQHLNHH